LGCQSEALLSRYSFVPLRRAVAILCMAMAVMLSGQTYIALMDRIDHAQNHVHFANPLAGDVAFCGGDHDQCGVHHHHHHADAAADHHHPHVPADHQHGDAAIVFLAAQSFVFAICPLEAARCESEQPAFDSISPRGPDHPPKYHLEIQA
jgi:hypothetical protein